MPAPWSLLFFLLLGSTALAQDDDLVLVANDSVQTTRLTRSEARKLLTGQSAVWPDRNPVVVVLPSRGSPASTWLATKVVRMPENVHRRYLLEKAFAGSIAAPVQVESDEESAAAVTSTPFAIAVVPRSEIGDGMHEVTIE